MNVTAIPTEYVPLEWPNVFNLLKPAIDRSEGRWSMAALLGALCRGDQVLWEVIDQGVIAALTTQIVNYPHCRMVAIQFLGGTRFDEWSADTLMLIERYAKSNGCRGVEAVGRFGFWPFFKQQGYQRAYCTYQKIFLEE